MIKTLLNNKGFSLIEVMVCVVIFITISGGLYGVLSTGQSTFFNTNTSIELRKNLRITLEKITRELHESGFDKNGVSQVTIGNGTGFNGTDVLRFSIPVICQTGMSVIDNNGDVAYWGAPLTWGCTTSTCMDADEDCSTIDYKYVEYLIDNSNQLVRRVLDAGSAVVIQHIFAQDITDFQVSTNANGDLVTLQISTQKSSPLNRIMSASADINVHLRNRG